MLKNYFYLILLICIIQGCNSAVPLNDYKSQKAVIAANYENLSSNADALIKIISVESLEETVYLTLQVSPELKNEYEALSYGFIKSYCSNQHTRAFLNSGVEYYIFIFEGSYNLISEFSIKRSLCVSEI